MKEQPLMELALDEEGYPTEESLNTIRRWPSGRYPELVVAIRKIWRYSDSNLWNESGDSIVVSTGGWSGNESIIQAMKGNSVFWMMSWKFSSRSGQHRFVVGGLLAWRKANVPGPCRTITGDGLIASSVLAIDAVQDLKALLAEEGAAALPAEIVQLKKSLQLLKNELDCANERVESLEGRIGI